MPDFVLHALGYTGNPVLHSFSIDSSSESTAMSLNQSLGLFAGEGGIIGRAVSVAENGRVIGEGVVGQY